MSVEIKVPTLPESVADALVLKWHKQSGEAVERDEVLVDIETDKVVLEVPSPVSGVVSSIMEDEGATVVAGQVLGVIGEGTGSESTTSKSTVATSTTETNATSPQTSPAVRRLIAERGLDVATIKGTGKGGRITKDDVLNFIETQKNSPEPSVISPSPESSSATVSGSALEPIKLSPPMGGSVPLGEEERPERRVPMTRLRARIAERLLYAQQSTAMLTTFNEVDMKPLMDMRKRYKELFEKTHDVRLGFMSMFVKASAEALKRFPDVNASLDGSDVVYHGFCDIGVAVSSDRGLVVPILRNAELMSLAETERQIGEYGVKAQSGKLSIEDMTGGTFTISNGGVFGSLFSTPILNPPQSAILGMHSIKDRPVVVDGEIVIRPMMYLALSYDHRIIDGKGAVTFLKTIKDLVEDPAKIMLDI